MNDDEINKIHKGPFRWIQARVARCMACRKPVTRPTVYESDPNAIGIPDKDL